MAFIIPLKLVLDLGSGSEFFDSVSDPGGDIDNGWPGVDYNLDLTIPPQLIQPVWIGVSADGTNAQVFQKDTPIADIITAGYPRVYQGTEIQTGEGDVLVFSDQYQHILLAMSACCGSSVDTAVYALKQSNYPLTVGEHVPCGAEAAFKWLAVRGSTETRNLKYTFAVRLTSADALTMIEGNLANELPLPVTTQMFKAWPDDFIGLTIGATTLVANNVVPGVGEMNVGDFDGGKIRISVTIIDDDTEAVVDQVLKEFALPSNCQDDESASDSASASASESAGSSESGSELDIPPSISALIDDSGGAEAYNAFPQPALMSDGSILSMWKRSIDHASIGPMMLGRTVDGGATWAKRQITIGGVDIECAALTLGVSGAYVVLSYQDDTDYDTVKFARCLQADLQDDFAGADFTACGSLAFDADYTSSPFGSLVNLPSGKIYFPYYEIGINANVGKCKNGLLQSTDNGATWTFGPTIYTEAGVNPVPGTQCSEMAVGIIELGVNDATTKLVVYMRNETNAYYSQGHSDDGGATWTMDAVNYFYEYGLQVQRSPLSVMLHDGLVYILDGRRNLSGVYTLEYVTCTPADARVNNQLGYSDPNTVLPWDANADTNGAALDWGYGMLFHDIHGALLAHFYDTAAVQDTPDRRCQCRQIIVDN